MNRTVKLVRYCKTEKGWKRLPAVIGRNGRVRPGYVQQDGKLIEYPQGNYQLRFYAGSKVQYESIGDNAAEALLKLHQKEKFLTAEDAAQDAGAVLVEEPSRLNLQKQLDRFILATQDRGSNVAAKVYKLAVDDFLAVTGKTYADKLTPDDMRLYVRALRGRGLSDRTLANRYKNVKAFLLFCGLSVKKLASAVPAYEKKLPEVYTAEELTAFFASLKQDYHKLVFNLLLKCGLRDQEAEYLCWSDIDLNAGMLRVRSKPELGFKVKDKEERELPLPPDLLEMLKAWRTEHPNTRIVLGTSTDKPNTKLLLLLKRLARAAGLNCGACDGCKERQECGRWYLHKFRHTFCTKLLRSGMDLSTVQALMGHSDIQSTMRYLRPHETDAVRDRVASINWAVD
jgi:integrase